MITRRAATAHTFPRFRITLVRFVDQSGVGSVKIVVARRRQGARGRFFGFLVRDSVRTATRLGLQSLADALLRIVEQVVATADKAAVTALILARAVGIQSTGGSRNGSDSDSNSGGLAFVDNDGRKWRWWYLGSRLHLGVEGFQRFVRVVSGEIGLSSQRSSE